MTDHDRHIAALVEAQRRNADLLQHVTDKDAVLYRAELHQAFAWALEQLRALPLMAAKAHSDDCCADGAPVICQLFHGNDSSGQCLSCEHLLECHQ